MTVVKKECIRCNKQLDVAQNFYSSKRLDKYPDGKVNLCKKCLTTYIDHYDTSTFVPILNELDIPYVEKVWVYSIVNKTKGKLPREISGMTVFGSYLSQMRLHQWKGTCFDDTESLNQQTIEEIQQDLVDSGRTDEYIADILETFSKMKNSYILKPGEIIPDLEDFRAMMKRNAEARDKAQREAAAAAAEEEKRKAEEEAAEAEAQQEQSSFNLALVDLAPDLTEDDVKYLYIKWGQYTPNEWVQLEQLWNQHMESFDIQTASHKDYLKLICKASLRANQFIDGGDVDGFNKVSKIYDQLMKSAKFTPVQNKEESGEYVSCLSELIAIAEKDGPIPRFYTPTPLDKVDETLEDMKLYTSRLIKEETNLGELIEQTLYELRNHQEESLFDNENDDEDNLEEEVLSDADYEEFYEAIEEQKQQDEGDDSDGTE